MNKNDISEATIPAADGGKPKPWWHGLKPREAYALREAGYRSGEDVLMDMLRGDLVVKNNRLVRYTYSINQKYEVPIRSLGKTSVHNVLRWVGFNPHHFELQVMLDTVNAAVRKYRRKLDPSTAIHVQYFLEALGNLDRSLSREEA